MKTRQISNISSAAFPARRGSLDSSACDLQYDNDFWRFSLAVYGLNDVAQECLALQESLKIDVNLLLFCAWMGTRKAPLTRTDIETASVVVETWHEHIVRPLRGIRRWIKTLHRDEFETYRTRVKGLEIEAEQIEHAILFAHAEQMQFRVAGAERRDAVAENIKRYLETKAGGGPTKTAQPSAPCLIDFALRITA